MKRFLVFLCSLMLVVGLAGSVSAMTLDCSCGEWVGSTGGVNVNLINDVATFPAYGNNLEDQIRWGDPFVPDNPTETQSGLGFTGSVGNGVGPMDIYLDTPFELGQLQHYNFTIWPSSAASAAELQITMDFSSPVLSIQSTFSFEIDETPNAPGPPLSDDIIDFPSSYAKENYEYNGHFYTLELLGFEQYGSMVDQFRSPENQTNDARLWARITEAPEVPEPASILLMGFGLLGLLGFIRKDSKKS